MKTKFSKNNAAAALLKGRTVWAVVTADPDSDETNYLAYASVFADRDDARKCLRETAAEDVESCPGSKIYWYDEGTDWEWCEIYYDCEMRIEHQLAKKTIQ